MTVVNAWSIVAFFSKGNKTPSAASALKIKHHLPLAASDSVLVQQFSVKPIPTNIRITVTRPLRLCIIAETASVLSRILLGLWVSILTVFP
jgi:hypothetical protein